MTNPSDPSNRRQAEELGRPKAVVDELIDRVACLEIELAEEKARDGNAGSEGDWPRQG